MSGILQAVFADQRSFVTVPGAPTIGTATAGITTASVTFTAPASDGGSAITSYTVTSSPGSLTGTGASSPITVTGLTGGTSYTFTVRAINAIGTGPASAASNSVTPINGLISQILAVGTGGTVNSGITYDSSGNLYALGGGGSTSLGTIVVYGGSSVSSKKKGYLPVNAGGAIYVDSSGNLYTFSVNTSSSTFRVQKFISGGGYWGYTYTMTNSADNAVTTPSITVDVNGNVYTSFYQTNSVNGGRQNITYKYNSAGTFQWSNTFSTASSTNSYNEFFNTAHLHVNTAGTYLYQAGRTYNTSLGQTGFNVMRRNTSDGSTSTGTFNYATGSSGTAYVYDSAYNATSDTLYVSGQCGASGLSGSGGFLAAYDSSTNLSVSAVFGDTSASPNNETIIFYGVALDPSGNVYAVGYSNSGSLTPTGALYVIKTDSSCNLIWKRKITTNPYSGVMYFQENRSNAVRITASASAYAISCYSTSGGWNVLEYPTDGTATGTNTVGGVAFTYANATNISQYSPAITSVTNSRASSAVSFTQTSVTDPTSVATNTVNITTI